MTVQRQFQNFWVTAYISNTTQKQIEHYQYNKFISGHHHHQSQQEYKKFSVPIPKFFVLVPFGPGETSKFYPARFWTVHDHDRFFQRLWSILGYSIKSTNFVELAVCKFFVISLGCLARNVVKRFLSRFSVTSIAKCGKDRHHF